MSDDKTLQLDVMAELAWDPHLDASHIGVAAEGAVVTLTGHVTSWAEKRAAVAAARRVRGVGAVANEIEVRLPADRKWHDDEIAKRAVDILHWSCPQVAPRVKITVTAGVLTLEGTVEHFFDRMEAERNVHRLHGIVRVDNHLIVSSQASLADVHDKIEAAFRRNANLAADHLSVTADGPVVTLRGRVRSWQEHDIAERAAWGAPGVTEVNNLIQVEP
ncbi:MULTISPECIES: BON domain-containing protein [Nitrospirillum]|uniref:BON domain-containing protein n=3 Tax=Nitrospirillum TaxID=1543705 RepID=A0A248K0I2_9PROT|nr:BON domain-containing protein [Nitrospirillum amazonense]ASG24487.1 hypothetical protein Y958_26815 [Nitrospirillum amazonense CBAmc]MEC4592025.1 BON domain-containing protein [Nitrospirillum amazonense]TWB23169.1 osmotically-inducible protein OsmY [Nitrospirillum amazonense]TWB37169.1 osmotically-inducible protein OsmY [Nitrospirillum amazonense]TWB47678.1 osmotically-inducible protein OsmY [Nitrospirillum amazonense]